MTWRTTLTGTEALPYATDTFTFGENRKILKQNIVVSEPGMECVAGRAKSQAGSETPLQKAWWFDGTTMGQGFHLAALDIDNIMMSYTENSIVQLHDTRTKAYIYFEGLTGIRQMHLDMIRTIQDADTGEAGYGIRQQLLELHEESSTVLFVFTTRAYCRATMTYVFDLADSNRKIVRMNMAVTTADDGPCGGISARKIVV